MKRYVKHFGYLFVFAVLALSVDAVASTVMNDQTNSNVVEGRVEAILPDVVQLQTSEGHLSININDINVEDMDVQFLQVGDTMSVAGQYDDQSSFDAEKLIEIQPYS